MLKTASTIFYTNFIQESEIQMFEKYTDLIKEMNKFEKRNILTNIKEPANASPLFNVD